MACRISGKWTAAFFAVGLLQMVWLGCGQSEKIGYRPARLHSERPEPDASPDTGSEAAEKAPSHDQLPITESIKSDGIAESTNSNEVLPVSALAPVNMIQDGSVRSLMNAVSAGQSQAASPNSESGISDSAASNPIAANKTEKAEPRKIELLVKDKVFRAEPKTGALKVVFDDLDLMKVLNMDPVVENAVELMPDWLRGLDGKTIRLRGVMFPTFESEGIERFTLARDSQACCFGPNAKIYDLVDVKLKEGKTTYYIPFNRFFDVVGKFRIELTGQDDKLFSLYFIDDAEVIDR